MACCVEDGQENKEMGICQGTTQRELWLTYSDMDKASGQ